METKNNVYNLELLKKPLPIEWVYFRVQSINKGGYATLLAYKDARADMKILDEVFGIFGWKREHSRDNKNCIISIKDRDTGEWVGKEDTGTESLTEKQKGLASDAFKRAGFNLGIGRELYDYPFIQVKLFDNEKYEDKGKIKTTYHFDLKKWSWDIKFNIDNIPTYLQAIDNNGNVRFTYRRPINEKEVKQRLASINTIEQLKDYFLEIGNLSKYKTLFTEKKNILTKQEKPQLPILKLEFDNEGKIKGYWSVVVAQIYEGIYDDITQIEKEFQFDNEVRAEILKHFQEAFKENNKPVLIMYENGKITPDWNLIKQGIAKGNYTNLEQITKNYQVSQDVTDNFYKLLGDAQRKLKK